MAEQAVSNRERTNYGDRIREYGEFTTPASGDFEIQTGLAYIEQFTIQGVETSASDRDAAWLLNSNADTGDDIAGQGGRVYFDSSAGALTASKKYNYIATGQG